MKTKALVCCLVFMAGISWAETVFPTATGTVWKYQMTQEFGAGVRPNDPSIKADTDGKVRLPITIAITDRKRSTTSIRSSLSCADKINFKRSSFFRLMSKEYSKSRAATKAEKE